MNFYRLGWRGALAGVATLLLVLQAANHAEALSGSDTVAIDFDTTGNTATNIGAGGAGIDAGDIQSSTGNTPLNAPITFDIVVDSVPSPGIFGAAGEVNYDPTLIKVTAVDRTSTGLLQYSAGSPSPFGGNDSLPDTDGSFRVDSTDIGGTDETGPGRVLTITLECIGTGVSAITLTDTSTGGGTKFGILAQASVFPVGTELEGTVYCNTDPPVVEIAVQQDVWRRIDRQLGGPIPELLWTGEPLVAPRGIVQLGDALYVTDPGDRTDPQKAARIVKFPLISGVPGQPAIFYQEPDFLLSAKWSVPAGGHHGGINALVVADQGEVLPDGTFTGSGAKVFLLPISEDGEAEEPQVLWQGSPLFCPTGVVVIHEIVYVTDPCAGPERTRPERPDDPFVTAALFAIPLAGGTPSLLWEGAPFTSLIGICDVEVGEDHSFIVHDTDSGRIDPTGAGGRAGFAPAAAAELWVFDIIDPSSANVTPPERIPFKEEGPITLRFTGVPDDAEIVVTTLSSNLFPDWTTQRVFSAADLDDDGTLTFDVASPVELGEVSIRVDIRDILTRIPFLREFIELFKDPDQTTQFVDNKHRGKIQRTPVSLFHFTLDQAQERAAVWVFPEGGGTPVAIAMGAPLVKPLSAQISDDQSTLWISDKSGALFSLQIPDIATLDSLFPAHDVGGTTELLVDDSAAPAESAGSTGDSTLPVAAAAGAVLVALAGAGLYVRRRLVR